MASMTTPLQGRIALITGAGSGIGRAAAFAFVDAGAAVALGDRDEESNLATAKEIEARGGDVIARRLDISDTASVDRFVTDAVSAFDRIDCAFNNAGIVNEYGPLHEITDDVWARLVNVNLTGTFNCLRREVEQFLAQGGRGAIVNTASVAGMVGLQGNAAYSSTKHGVVGLTRAAALDYARTGIRVNAVCPGGVDTDMVARAFSLAENPAEVRAQAEDNIPVGRLGQPDEIAAAAVWLCSDSTSFVTGHALAVDGGMLAG
jgi:NAD(P)-dependent dehydrogenase (short-subunit alcohol dehydrogenase family)